MKKFFKIVGFVVLAFIALIVIVGIFGPSSNKSKTSNASNSGNSVAVSSSQSGSNPTSPPPDPKPSSIRVSASELFKSYEKNEVASDQKYKGQTLTVTGTVQSIDKDFTNDIVVRLKTSNPFMPVDAYLDSELENLAASLSKGAKVSWVCRGGGRVVGSPVLRDCQPA